MQPFCINSHGRMVFPSNFRPDLDFTVLHSLDQLEEVIRRDFEAKAPSGTEILRRIEAGDHYRNRFELMRDVALNLFWTNRFAMTMYEKRPTRWRDVPKGRDDVFLPVLAPWQDAQRKVDAVQAGFAALAPAWDPQVEDEIFRVLFDVLRHRRFHATELPALKPTVAQLLAEPDRLTYSLAAYDPDYPVYGDQQILDCAEDVPELEALHRWAMVLHDQYPWDRGQTRLTPVGALRDDDYVVVFHPRNRDVLDFIRRMRRDEARPPRSRDFANASTVTAQPPVRPFPPVRVRERFSVLPRLEALAVVKGERLCTNEDLIRNSAYSWSPMSAVEIIEKTGIESRVYTARPLEDIALQAARSALAHAGRAPEEIGAVLFCTCTNSRLMPSVAAWLSGQLGIAQTYCRVRHRRRLRRAALRAGRGHPAAAGGGPPGPAGLRGEVLRQDRRGPAGADDLRGRRRRARAGARSTGGADRHRGPADLRRRPGQRSQFDRLAQSRVRQQHHGVRTGGALDGGPLPPADGR